MFGLASNFLCPASDVPPFFPSVSENRHGVVAIAKEIFPELKQCCDVFDGHRMLHSGGECSMELDETLQRSANRRTHHTMLIGGRAQCGGNGVRDVPSQRHRELHDGMVNHCSEAPQVPTYGEQHQPIWPDDLEYRKCP